MKLLVLILLAVIVTTTSCQKFNKEIRQLFDEPMKTLIVYEDAEPRKDHKKTVADLKRTPYDSSESKEDHEFSEEKRNDTKETRNELKKTYEDFKETPEYFNKISEDSNRHGKLEGQNIVRPQNTHLGPRKKVLVKKRGGLLHTNFDHNIISNNITNTRLKRTILPENKTPKNSKKKFPKKHKQSTIHDTDEDDDSSIKRNKNKSKRQTRSTILKKSKQKNKAKKRKSKRRFKSTTSMDSEEDGVGKTKRNKKLNKLIKHKKSKSALKDKEHTSKQSKERKKFKRQIKSTKLEDSGHNTSKTNISEMRKRTTWPLLFEKSIHNLKTEDNQRTIGTPKLEYVSIKSRLYKTFQPYNEKPFLSNHQPNRVNYLPIRQNIIVRYPQKRMNPIVATHYVPSVSMFMKQYSNKNVIPNNGKMQDCCNKNHQKCQACHKGIMDVYIPIHLKLKDNPQNVNITSGENSQKRNELEFLKRKKRETIITVIDTMPPNRPLFKRVPFKKSPGKRHPIFNMNYLDHKDSTILYRPKKNSVTPSYGIRVPKFAPSRGKLKDYEDWLELDTIYRKIAKQNKKNTEKTNKGTRYHDSHNFKDYSANTNFKKKEYPKTHVRPMLDQTNKRFRYEDKYGESKYFPDENNKINHYTQHKISYEDKQTQKKKYSKNNFQNSYDTESYPPDMVIREIYLPNVQYEMSYEENRRPEKYNPEIVHEGFGTKTVPNKEKYLSDSQYEMTYETKQIKKPYPKNFHQDRYGTKTYPEDINNENNSPNREHEMTYEEKPIPKKSYLKKFHQDTLGTKPYPLVNLPNREYERPYEDRQRLGNHYYTNNNEDLYDTKTYFSDINKKHHPKGFNKMRYEETEPEITFENQQRPENNQPSMIDNQDTQSSRLKIRHKDTYHPNSNNPVLDHIHKNRPLKKHQENSGAKIHQLKKSPQENIESHYNDVQYQDSIAAESKYSQTNQGHQTIVTKTPLKQHRFAEPPKYYVHPEPSQPFKFDKFLYDEKTNTESDTNDQPLGTYTKNQPSMVEFYDELDKTSELSHKTRYFTTVSPKSPQGFIEPVKDFSYVELPRSVDFETNIFNNKINPVKVPNNDSILQPISQLGNTFVYEEDTGIDLETNVNHGINDESLDTNSQGQSFDVEAFYDQHEIILPKKRYRYQTTVPDQKHEKSSSPPKDDKYAELFDEESTNSKLKPNLDIINSPLLPQSVNHFLTDEALEDEFDHMFIKVKSNTTTPHRTTISSTTNRFREVSNDETYREGSTSVFDKPLHEKNKLKDHESKLKDKRPRINFHNPMRHLGTTEVSYDQYDTDYIMTTSNIESDPEDDSRLLSSGNDNQNRSHSKNSHSRVIVGGQYAEPPARYIPKLRVRSISQDSSTITPYINYKNSNMAFSPQNLNDAFSVMK